MLWLSNVLTIKNLKIWLYVDRSLFTTINALKSQHEWMMWKYGIIYILIGLMCFWYLCWCINVFICTRILLFRLTCITRIGRPVSFASCSLICLVGFGVWLNAVLRISSCFALIVVRGPRRFEPPPSSGLLLSACESLRPSGSPSREP